MAIRCGNCKGRHDTVMQVLECSALQPCKHGLAPRTCITCASWNRRRGFAHTRSFVKNPPQWLTDTDLKASGTCAICLDVIVQGQEIWTRRGRKQWAHRDCITDPGAATAEPLLKSQREPDPEYNDAYSRIAALERAADDLLAEAIEVEQETDILCLKQVAQDMDYHLSIDLIRETIFGYDLEMLGAWEPQDESDFVLMDEDDVASLQAQADLMLAYSDLDSLT